MNKKQRTLVLLAAAFVLLLVLASLLYARLGGDSGRLMAESDPAGSTPAADSAADPVADAAPTPTPALAMAPDFTVYDAGGEPVRLSDFRGTPVVINFWASWCGPCQSEMPAFDAAAAEMEACYSLPGIRVAGVFQHFAVADSLTGDDIAYTQEQHALFARLVDRLRADGFDPGVTHCANSAAQLLHPEWRCDLVRAGIILYGLAPSGQVGSPALRPAMRLKAVVTHVKQLLPGQSVSYGRAFTARQPMQVATISVGYADGYPRRLSNLGAMTIQGKAAPVLGRVCMDQTIVDVTDIPGVQPGDEVLVFGPGAAPGADTADTVAEKTGTINYEIICGISRRVPRVYLQNGEVIRIWNDLEEAHGTR